MMIKLSISDYREFKHFWFSTRTEQVQVFRRELPVIPIWFGFHATDQHLPDTAANENGDIAYLESKPDQLHDICSTNGVEDLWLFRNCPVQSVREQIAAKYPSDWIGHQPEIWFDDLPRMIEIYTENSALRFFRENQMQNGIEHFDQILIMGTSFVSMMLYDVFNNIWHPEKPIEGLNAVFYYYGVFVENRGGQNYIKDTEQTISIGTKHPPIRIVMPAITQTFISSLADNYRADEIIFSDTYDAYMLKDRVPDATVKTMKEHVMILPKYLHQMLA